jgi:hypothetical protein
MLGVRRVRVTIIANALQKAGIIRYRRGRITIVDRAALQGSACECYQTVQLEQLFGTASGERSS